MAVEDLLVTLDWAERIGGQQQPFMHVARRIWMHWMLGYKHKIGLNGSL